MRTKPVFESDASQNPTGGYQSLGCFWLLVLSVGGYFVFLAIDRVLSGSGDRFDRAVCYSVLICLVLLVVAALRQGAQDRGKRREEQQAWKQAGRSAKVAIVNREYSPSSSWEDEYGMPHSSHARCTLWLESTAEQRALFPDMQSVSVDVDEYLYRRLADRKVVRIWYQPDSPMTFLLEEEFA